MVKSFCNRVWRGEGWPEGWKEGMIIPIIKKGEGIKVEEYRGVTLLSTLYMGVADGVREEMERKGILPRNQTGFRKGLGTIDNIFVINYLVNRQLVRRGGSMTAFFEDLKAAFALVDRGGGAGGSDERERERGGG